MVTVFLAKALLCFSGVCHPVLIGNDTPTGEYQLHRIYVAQEGYGGDVLMFTTRGKRILAIHRVWTKRPEERRVERLASDDANQRKGITKGCINVSEEVYAQLMDCCSDSTLVIK